MDSNCQIEQLQNRFIFMYFPSYIKIQNEEHGVVVLSQKDFIHTNWFIGSPTSEKISLILDFCSFNSGFNSNYTKRQKNNDTNVQIVQLLI